MWYQLRGRGGSLVSRTPRKAAGSSHGPFGGSWYSGGEPAAAHICLHVHYSGQVLDEVRRKGPVAQLERQFAGYRSRACALRSQR